MLTPVDLVQDATIRPLLYCMSEDNYPADSIPTTCKL